MNHGRIGIEFQLPLRQLFDTGSVDPFNHLFRELSLYRRPGKLGVGDLVQIADRSVFFLVAFDLDHGEFLGHRLVGITRMEPKSRLDGLRRGEIHDTVVLHDRRREHIGEALTRRAIEEARHLGYRCIELTCKPAREAAIAMYEKLGFELITAADPTVEGSENLYRLLIKPTPTHH